MDCTGPTPSLPCCAARRGPLELLTEEEAVIGGVELAALLRAVEGLGHGAVRPRPCTLSPGQAGGGGGSRAPAPAGAQERQQRAHGVDGGRAPRWAALGDPGPAARRCPLLAGAIPPARGLDLDPAPPLSLAGPGDFNGSKQRPINCQ